MILTANRKSLIGLSLIAGLALAGCADDIYTRGQGLMPDLENGDVSVMLRVADSTRESGDPAAAVPLYRRAHKLAPEDPRPLIALAETLVEIGAYDDAAEVWVQALRLDDMNARALRGYGNTLVALGQPQLAMTRFAAANELEPDPATYNGMGVAYDVMGDAANAQDSYRDGLVLAPDDVSLQNNLGLSLALDGQYDEALALLEPIGLAPGATARQRQNLALAYGLNRDYEMAERLGRLDLDEVAVRQNLAYYDTLRGIDDHARKVAAVGTFQARLNAILNGEVSAR